MLILDFNYLVIITDCIRSIVFWLMTISSTIPEFIVAYSRPFISITDLYICGVFKHFVWKRSSSNKLSPNASGTWSD